MIRTPYLSRYLTIFLILGSFAGCQKTDSPKTLLDTEVNSEARRSQSLEAAASGDSPLNLTLPESELDISLLDEGESITNKASVNYFDASEKEEKKFNVNAKPKFQAPEQAGELPTIEGGEVKVSLELD